MAPSRGAVILGRPIARRHHDEQFPRAPSHNGSADPRPVDHVVLREDLAGGEHVRRFAIDLIAFPHSQPITVWEGYNIGHKAICRFPQVKAKTVTMRIMESTGVWSLRSADLYRADC